jgi:hypothetical protein
MAVCRVCGKEFDNYRGKAFSRATCCSDECRRELNRQYARKTSAKKQSMIETRVCEMCGKEFQATLSQTTKFCSKECLYKSNGELRKGRVPDDDIATWKIRPSHIDDILAEARIKKTTYAELQKQKTLKLAGKIDTDIRR